MAGCQALDSVTAARQHYAMHRRALLAAPASLLLPTLARADPLTDGTFARHVIQLLATAHPDWPVSPGPDTQTLNVKNASVFLGNLYRQLQTVPASARDRTTVTVIERGLAPPNPVATYAAARPKLRLQLAPAEYLQATPSIVSRPFLAGLVITYAIDEPDRFATLLRPQLDAWKQSRETVEQDAFANLEIASMSVAVQAERADAVGGYALVESHDGYDAARLLLPRFTARLRATLKAPLLLAAIPNRDMLVLWTPDFAARSHIRGKIVPEAGRAPHPLTQTVFAVTDGPVRLATEIELLGG